MSETMRISREHFGAPQRVGLPHLLDQTRAAACKGCGAYTGMVPRVRKSGQ
jgi:hypothetical protein